MRDTLGLGRADEHACSRPLYARLVHRDSASDGESRNPGADFGVWEAIALHVCSASTLELALGRARAGTARPPATAQHEQDTADEDVRAPTCMHVPLMP